MTFESVVEQGHETVVLGHDRASGMRAITGIAAERVAEGRIGATR